MCVGRGGWGEVVQEWETGILKFSEKGKLPKMGEKAAFEMVLTPLQIMESLKSKRKQTGRVLVWFFIFFKKNNFMASFYGP